MTQRLFTLMYQLRVSGERKVWHAAFDMRTMLLNRMSTHWRRLKLSPPWVRIRDTAPLGTFT